MNGIGVKSQEQEKNSFVLPALVISSAVTGVCGVIAMLNIMRLSELFQNCQDLNCVKEKISLEQALSIFCVVSPLIAGGRSLGLYRSAEKVFSAFQNAIVKSKQTIDFLSSSITRASSENERLSGQVSCLRRENEGLKRENDAQKWRKENTDRLISRIEELSTEKSTMQLEIDKLKALNDRYRKDLRGLKK